MGDGGNLDIAQRSYTFYHHQNVFAWDEQHYKAERAHTSTMSEKTITNNDKNYAVVPMQSGRLFPHWLHNLIERHLIWTCQNSPSAASTGINQGTFYILFYILTQRISEMAD